ncbi:MAG: hypothetical protein BAJATHORv1_10207 [Candidatus Thorarchaeota archaeon]|nr:MAG: hypothetical protein BAJATHORv1_10207 [Candidatus Thorarchaeota archaeon]
MESLIISRDEILKSTLFHIQVKRCQFIDNFPEVVTEVIHESMVEKGISDYAKLKRKLYRIDTNFFTINKDKIKKKDFYESLYSRIQARAS